MSETPEPERLTFIVRRYGAIDDNWSPWDGKTFEEVCERAVERVADGKASSDGLEVVEVQIVRAVKVRPVIERVEVTR